MMKRLLKDSKFAMIVLGYSKKRGLAKNAGAL